MKKHIGTIVAILAALLAAFAVTITVTEEGDVKISVTKRDDQNGAIVTVGAAASPQEPVVVADADNELETDELEDSVDPGDLGPGVHEDARDEAPPGAPLDALEQVLDSPETGVGKPKPAVGAQNYSCPQRFVENFSDRAGGSKVLSFKMHVAVARAGALPVIRRLFDTPSFGASSHLGLDQDGTCEQWVPFSKKAWTQGAFNSTSESIEIMAIGNETRAQWLAMPIIRNGILASIVADRLRARGLPPRLVDPVGCTDRAGYTDHARLECGNTHVDVGRGFPWTLFGEQLRRAYNGGAVVVSRPRCTDRNIERAIAKRRPALRIVVDGKIGPRTRSGIRSFQSARGLRPDGIVGPRTGRALGLRGC
jgi:peptidoglycan hydrolase-like protein with peptidoglycan-binding domain